MIKKRNTQLTPSEFYKLRRPEYFSDSEIVKEIELPKEVLILELKNITTNQKENDFELLCRRLAEKFISPNLIPQVGPTGGGDGKTDSETYPVSKTISDRWFIPENGWTKDEKWAFAISAKQRWKSKVKSDVKKIIGTGREYTRVYFMTNQLPSSKKKKDAQDELINEFKVDVVILDGKWILEKIYNNNLIELVVNSLNMSQVYLKSKTVLGENDAYRIKKLEEVENNINNPKRYFEYDFQLVEDALETAILSRMLEKPRDEVEGKFDRAFRFCKKVNNEKQWIRLLYQRAWTHLNWYDDYSSFIEDYKAIKKYFSQSSSISEIELYFNLFNLLNGLSYSGNCNLSDFKIDIKNEQTKIIEILNTFETNDKKPCSALIASTYKSLIGIMDSISNKENPDNYFRNLSKIINKSSSFFDFPFDSFKEIIEDLGKIFPNNDEFDNLINCVAIASEKRNSELAAGKIYLRRGSQKLYAKYYKESVIYFGKAVLKLAKEESKNGMYLSLMGLANAYCELGLIWASNNCYISASSISFRDWYESGKINKRVYQCVKQLAFNELLIGRIPPFFIWHELFLILYRQLDSIESKENIPADLLLDGCLATRIINTNIIKDRAYTYLPDLFESHSLVMSKNSLLYKLGYIDLLNKEHSEKEFKDEKSMDDFFKIVANQPFRCQMLYNTNFISDEENSLVSVILGCKFVVNFPKNKEMMLIAETLLAYFESFFATSLKGVYPKSEVIRINIVNNNVGNFIEFDQKDSNYEFKINKFSFKRDDMGAVWKSMIEFTIHILVNNFFIDKPLEYIENLFKEEELNERLSLIFEHRNFTHNILGDDLKLFLDDWLDTVKLKKYPMKRNIPISFPFENKLRERVINKDFNSDNVSHNKRKVFSIIDDELWNKAEWNGFGYMSHPYYGFGLLLCYNHGDAGRKIFENWIKLVGKEDKKELIKLTIIKGIDKNNPHWYRVLVSTNIDKESLESCSLFMVASRFHEMNPTSSKNLDDAIHIFNSLKHYILYPAKIADNGIDIEPFLDMGILKRKLDVRDAWEIGENDLDCIAIKENDQPIIPDDISDAPILKLLQRKYIKKFYAY